MAITATEPIASPARVDATAGRRRVVIEGVSPEIDAGRFPIKRTVGESVVVEADIFTDGHDALACILKHRREGAATWSESPLEFLGNDRWRGRFRVSEMGRHQYMLEAWVDAFSTWQNDLKKRLAAGQQVPVELLIGARLVEAAAAGACGDDARRLAMWAAVLADENDSANRLEVATSEALAALMARYPDREYATIYDKQLAVVVDRPKACFSTWYEMFPRSSAAERGRHGTFNDCEAWLPYIAQMGFDVLYFPPIHPIGLTYRKGKNNSLTPGPDDVGSPWGIGAPDGGHKSIHPLLGTADDFRRLVAKANEHGIEIALDIACQCSPDHPYVKEHPEWFRWRPDGTVQYAENPPKKYQDIYPFNFDTEAWQELWEELKDIIVFWIGEGVKIFRVDNPHTKPFAFWEWMITDIKASHPEVIFLSEAFTRPRVLYRLAKLGFTQSYNYFPWRNTKHELTEYLTELTKSHVREYCRPSLWTNTPDILTEYLQFGGRPAFMARYVLAATLGASCGILGPSFEQCLNRPREPGSEEYLDSEKYEVRHWDLNHPDSLQDFIARVNRIRHQNPALQSDWSLRFHPVDNDQLICYSKQSEDQGNTILTVVNLDPHHTQSGWVHLPLAELALDPARPYQMHDLLGEARYLWDGPRNYVELNPHVVPAHIFRVRRRVRTESQFEYFL